MKKIGIVLMGLTMSQLSHAATVTATCTEEGGGTKQELTLNEVPATPNTYLMNAIYDSTAQYRLQFVTHSAAGSVKVKVGKDADKKDEASSDQDEKSAKNLRDPSEIEVKLAKVGSPWHRKKKKLVLGGELDIEMTLSPHGNIRDRVVVSCHVTYSDS